MVDFVELKQEAVWLCDNFMKNDFHMPDNLPYNILEYYILGELANTYFNFKRSVIDRKEAVSIQSQLFELFEEGMMNMNCLKCGRNDLKVVDVRNPDCESVYRRRKCLACGHRFSTIEYEVELVKGRKKNGKK